MRPWMGHVATFLLGLTLSITFYEGRRLVQTTADALSAASALDEPERPRDTQREKEQARRERPAQAVPQRVEPAGEKGQKLREGKIGKAGKVRVGKAGKRRGAKAGGRLRATPDFARPSGLRGGLPQVPMVGGEEVLEPVDGELPEEEFEEPIE